MASIANQWEEQAYDTKTRTRVNMDAGDEEIVEHLVAGASLVGGLNSEQVEELRKVHGWNEEPQKKTNWILVFLSHFVGVAPIILEATFIAAMALQDWVEAGVVMALLLFNGIVAFIQEVKGHRAMEELRASLHITARVLRSKEWLSVGARELVPGDIIRVRMGDMVPADFVLLQGGPLECDQSALTGESRPVQKDQGARIFAGSVVAHGEGLGVVIFTGMKTKFNKTLHLVSTSKPAIHMTNVITKVVIVEMTGAAIMIVVAIVYLVADPMTRSTFASVLPLLLVLLAFSAPVTLPPMITLTMALASQYLAKRNVLVTRLNAVEDVANMTILCTDKTGTLTSNTLAVVDVLPSADFSKDDVILYAACASKAENMDAIDSAILKMFQNGKRLPQIEQLDFEPFSAATRKTVAHVRINNQDPPVEVSKGAVLTLEQVCSCSLEERARLDAQVIEFSKSGHRTLAVCVNRRICGLICLADPPRLTSAATVEELKGLGIRVFMITGDNLQVAGFVANAVGIGTPASIASMEQWRAMHLEKYGDHHVMEPGHDLEQINGLAQILPEDKHAVVTMFQTSGYVVGMTGDGVNDAPALKLAEVGIAMSNATDVAKGAASVVLMHEGLDSVPFLVKIGRRVHARLTTWVLIRLVKTFQTIGFVVLMYLITKTWVVTSLNMLELLFLVDFVSLSLSTDRMSVSRNPCEWRILRLCIIGAVVGVLNLGQAVGLWFLLRSIWSLSVNQVHTASFVIMFFFGLLSIFAIRVRGFFWKARPSLVLAVVAMADIAFVLVTCMVGVPAIDLTQIPVGCAFLIVGFSAFCNLVVNNFVLTLLWHFLFKDDLEKHRLRLDE